MPEAPASLASATADEGPSRGQDQRSDLVELALGQQACGRAVVELGIQALEPGPGNGGVVVLGDQPGHPERQTQPLRIESGHFIQDNAGEELAEILVRFITDNPRG